MNRAETYDLLTQVALGDNRKFGDETAVFWQELLADVEFVDAAAAVREHFATSDAYLMPVHIIRGARAARLARIESAPTCSTCTQSVLSVYHTRWCSGQPAIEAPEVFRPRDVRKLIESVRDKLPDADPLKFRRPEVVEWERQREREQRPDAGPNPHYDPTVRADPPDEPEP